MILAALAMVYAGVLEIYRKKDMEANGSITQSLGKDNFTASKLSMFIQIPEFAFIGSSEVFASISGEFSLAREFAYIGSSEVFAIISGESSLVSACFHCSSEVFANVLGESLLVSVCFHLFQ